MKTITYNPETHKLVPIEPTDEMLKTLTITASLEASWASAYKAMLNAAPAAEEAPQREHDLKDVRCEYCGYLTHQREHMGCLRAAKQQPATHGEPVTKLFGSLPVYESPQPTPELRRLHKVEKHAEWLSDEISELKILDASRLHSLQVAGEMYESLQEKNSELVKVMEQALEAFAPLAAYGRVGSRDIEQAKAQQAITDLQNALMSVTDGKGTTNE